jgi:O-methyltransferase
MEFIGVLFMPFSKAKIIVFGAGDGAKVITKEIADRGEPIEIVAYTDNNVALQNTILFGKPVIHPDKIGSYEYDQIILATTKIPFIENIIEQLTNEYGIARENINEKLIFCTDQFTARITALKNISELLHKNSVNGAVAEVGVFQGEFTQHINEYFNDRTLYLFDTFEGFSKVDIEAEHKIGMTDKILETRFGFSNTTEKLVLERLDFPEKCIIKKGYFPKTAQGLEEKFAFVSLDADLYQPMLAGLEYFYPRLEKGGYIFVHDFFDDFFTGTRQAVLDYKEKANIVFAPLGDDCSIAIMKL